VEELIPQPEKIPGQMLTENIDEKKVQHSYKIIILINLMSHVRYCHHRNLLHKQAVLLNGGKQRNIPPESFTAQQGNWGLRRSQGVNDTLNVFRVKLIPVNCPVFNWGLSGHKR